MKRLFIISLVVSLLLPSVSAQTLTNQQRRHINSKILTLIEDYERYASLYDEEAEYYFRSLFVNETSTVHCDMIASDKYRTQVPVDEYVSMVRQHSQNTVTAIKNVRKGEMAYSNGVWYIPVSFRKSFSYMDANGYLFSVEDWHKTDFDMEMYVMYDEDRDMCLIQTITGKLDTNIDFPKGRFLIVNEDQNQDRRYMEHFSTLRVNNKPIDFNEFAQAIIAPGVAYVADMDVVVDTVVLSKGFNYDVVSYKFNPRKARIKLRYGMAPMKAYRVMQTSDTKAKAWDKKIADKSSAMEAGVDFGFAFPFGRNSKMGLYTGAGVSLSTLDLSLNSMGTYKYKTSYFNEASQLYESAEVSYSVNGASEGIKYMDLFVPVYFELEHRLGSHLMLSWSMGAKAYYNLSAKNYAPYQVSASAKVNSISLKNASVSVPGTFTGFIEPNSYANDKGLDFSAFANMGLDINLVKRKIYLMVRAGYEYGFTPAYQSTTSDYMSGSSYPIVCTGLKQNGSSVQGTHVAVHSLVSGLTLYRQAWWFSTGFKFKL